MSRSKAMAIATVSAGAGVGVAWHRSRQARRFVDGHEAIPPHLPGVRRSLPTPWGSIAYRWIEGDQTLPTLVLIHGWGKTGDSAWWPVLGRRRTSMAVVDLPGHGESGLSGDFSFEVAAAAVLGVIEDAGLESPLLVAHSMGGPVALTAIQAAGAAKFTGMIALASSAYWVRPRVRATIALAPYLMGPRSPLLAHTERSDLIRLPDWAPHIAWSYTHRASGHLLKAGANALRHFDVRDWAGLEMPPTHWVVATGDRVLPPSQQHASARLLGATVHELETSHSMVLEAPEAVGALLDRVAQGSRKFRTRGDTREG